MRRHRRRRLIALCLGALRHRGPAANGGAYLRPENGFSIMSFSTCLWHSLVLPPKQIMHPCAGIDGGGSVRVPSALCGIVGLRPTVGRTSTQHCPENAFSIMSFGTHTGCVADAMLVYSVIANAGAHLRPTCPSALATLLSPVRRAEAAPLAFLSA
jgi:hypothetical protein